MRTGQRSVVHGDLWPDGDRGMVQHPTHAGVEGGLLIVDDGRDADAENPAPLVAAVDPEMEGDHGARGSAGGLFIHADLDHLVVQEPDAARDVLTAIRRGRHVLGQLVRPHPTPALQHLVAVPQLALGVGDVSPHGPQFLLVRDLPCGALGVVSQVDPDRFAVEVRPCGQLLQLRLGHDVPLKYVPAAFEILGLHVRENVPDRHPLEEWGGFLGVLHAPLQPVVRPLSALLVGRQRPLEHPGAGDAAVDENPTTGLTVVAAALGLQELVAHPVFHGLGVPLRGVLDELFLFLGEHSTGEVRNRRGSDVPILLIRREQDVHEVGNNGRDLAPGVADEHPAALRVHAFQLFGSVLAHVLPGIAQPPIFQRLALGLSGVPFGADFGGQGRGHCSYPPSNSLVRPESEQTFSASLVAAKSGQAAMLRRP